MHLPLENPLLVLLVHSLVELDLQAGVVVQGRVSVECKFLNLGALAEKVLFVRLDRSLQIL
jgi:hypothetical protein